MFEAGNIIYFDPFYFDNGNAPKPKYFLVLRGDETTVLATLPSSKAHLPNHIELKHGCLELSEQCITCYIFLANRPITKCNWFFELNTFMHANWLANFDLKILNETYNREGVDYRVIGSLLDEEFEKVKACFRSSPVVKQKYKRLL